ncbi:MAG: nuclease A inhibitor family protein [Ginsengibacter sp.]
MDLSTFKQSLIPLTDKLLYSSESDYPFEFVDVNNKNQQDFIQTIKALYPADAPSSTMTGSDFFNRTIHNLEMSGDDVMIAVAGRYKKLQSFLASNAQDVSIWRFGKTEVGIYIVIQTHDAGFAVLKTTSIET